MKRRATVMMLLVTMFVSLGIAVVADHNVLKLPNVVNVWLRGGFGLLAFVSFLMLFYRLVRADARELKSRSNFEEGSSDRCPSCHQALGALAEPRCPRCGLILPPAYVTRSASSRSG